MKRLVSIGAVALVMAGTAPDTRAEYDREGRYVPSPMGIPADPHARPVPGYTGTPGGTRGTPWEPPLAPAPPLAPITPRVGPPPPATSPPLTITRCQSAWSAKLRMSRDEFEIRCRKLLKSRSS